MKLQIVSDLHLEFGFIDLPVCGDVLILAGDIGVLAKPSYLCFLSDLDFAKVFYVAGNHEFYHSSIDYAKLQSELPSNVILLENSSYVYEGVTFLGATLWSDLSNPLSAMCANHSMNDFRIIDNFKAADATARFLESKDYIFSNPADVVITHHAPSFLSTAPEFVGNALNPAFASELDGDIASSNIRLWVHGHMHNSSNYNIGNTKVICNPRGYVGYQTNLSFNPGLVYEI